MRAKRRGAIAKLAPQRAIVQFRGGRDFFGFICGDNSQKGGGIGAGISRNHGRYGTIDYAGALDKWDSSAERAGKRTSMKEFGTGTFELSLPFRVGTFHLHPD